MTGWMRWIGLPGGDGDRDHDRDRDRDSDLHPDTPHSWASVWSGAGVMLQVLPSLEPPIEGPPRHARRRNHWQVRVVSWRSRSKVRARVRRYRGGDRAWVPRRAVGCRNWRIPIPQTRLACDPKARTRSSGTTRSCPRRVVAPRGRYSGERVRGTWADDPCDLDLEHSFHEGENPHAAPP